MMGELHSQPMPDRYCWQRWCGLMVLQHLGWNTARISVPSITCGGRIAINFRASRGAWCFSIPPSSSWPRGRRGVCRRHTCSAAALSISKPKKCMPLATPCIAAGLSCLSPHWAILLTQPIQILHGRVYPQEAPIGYRRRWRHSLPIPSSCTGRAFVLGKRSI